MDLCTELAPAYLICRYLYKCYFMSLSSFKLCYHFNPQRMTGDLQDITGVAKVIRYQHTRPLHHNCQQHSSPHRLSTLATMLHRIRHQPMTCTTSTTACPKVVYT
ncbi:predicted protein [Lichtheimia corymbifera JMRC:FSU:9682]|uniref:Uncharacterized protein n=1 Tax=Lichtheimia corymbifera JMRC:FSU:9682 TaxID=1263082 RepID=A0A068RRJ8_9FUNG|nr:predicted protein [Lichtheimia corymbifera JMRC:FSU:9682]